MAKKCEAMLRARLPMQALVLSIITIKGKA